MKTRIKHMVSRLHKHRKVGVPMLIIAVIVLTGLVGWRVWRVTATENTYKAEIIAEPVEDRDEPITRPAGDFSNLGMSIDVSEMVRLDAIAQHTVGSLDLYQRVRGSKVVIEDIRVAPEGCKGCYLATATFTSPTILYAVPLSFFEGEASISGRITETRLNTR